MTGFVVETQHGVMMHVDVSDDDFLAEQGCPHADVAVIAVKTFPMGESEVLDGPW